MGLESPTNNRFMALLSLSGIIMSIATILIILYSMQYIQNQRDLLRNTFDSHVQASETRFDNDERRMSEIARDMHQRIGSLEQMIFRNGGPIRNGELPRNEHGSPPHGVR